LAEGSAEPSAREWTAKILLKKQETERLVSRISRNQNIYRNRVILLSISPVYGNMRSEMALLMSEKIEAEMTAADFDAWMTQEQRRIYLLCFRILRNNDEADSAAQDVFVKAFRVLKKYGDHGIREPARWLTRVAVNTCMDRLNYSRWAFWRRRIAADDETLVLELKPAPGLNQEETLLEREKMQRLNRSLRRLSKRQRLVFILKHDEGMNLDEIAEILGIDIGTVKAHMARAVGKLREELRDLYAR
jgi:RNA polymerase sigma-70 factor, ECF subfamily